MLVSSFFFNAFNRAAYAAFVGFMGYAEGYMGFQTKFSPLVVARSADLANSRPEAGLVGFLKWCAKVAMAPVSKEEMIMIFFGVRARGRGRKKTAFL